MVCSSLRDGPECGLKNRIYGFCRFEPSHAALKAVSIAFTALKRLVFIFWDSSAPPPPNRARALERHLLGDEQAGGTRREKTTAPRSPRGAAWRRTARRRSGRKQVPWRSGSRVRFRASLPWRRRGAGRGEDGDGARDGGAGY